MRGTLVTEISIFPIKSQNGLVAFADCVLDNKFYVGGIGVYTDLKNLGEFRLVFPNKVLANGKYVPLFHPVSESVNQELKLAISNEVNRLFFPENSQSIEEEG